MNRPSDKIIQYSLYGAAAFVVLLTLFAFVSRDNLFRFLNDPRIPFQTYIPPAAPDYTDPAAWLIPPQATKEASVFVVLPTSYWGGKNWNMPLGSDVGVARLKRVALPNWAAPFADAGTIAVPLYRAASLYSFLTVRGDAREARSLAYRDVLTAFDVFLAKTGDKGPIILVGVEQGGLHVLGLLQDRFNDPYVRERLAVAYVVDFAVPLDLFDGALSGLAPCANKEDSRCIVTYGAFHPKEKSEITRFTDRSMVWGQNGLLQQVKDRPLACVNPLLGGTSTDFAPKRLHKGAVAATGLEWGATPAPMPAQTSAQCVDGILLVDRPKSHALRKPLGFGKRFKPDPFNLFYEDLSSDAKRRVDNLNKRFAIEGRLAPPFKNAIEIIDSPIRSVPGG
ncbi:MAG: hypothetical protein COA84_00850 [Robiginitomaculum sp.]|nr:MAG: hypothetical protein COA84_00850 [Robiginitomaculum sp.]